MPYTVWMDCGCVLSPVEVAENAICADHSDAKPTRRQHYSASGSGPVEAANDGSWFNLTDPVRFEKFQLRRATRTGRDPTAETASELGTPTLEEIRDFTRMWLAKRAKQGLGAATVGRFQTLEVDDDDDV